MHFFARCFTFFVVIMFPGFVSNVRSTQIILYCTVIVTGLHYHTNKSGSSVASDSQIKSINHSHITLNMSDEESKDALQATKRRRLDVDSDKSTIKALAANEPCSLVLQNGENITPETIWKDFVSQRKPCVINTLPLLRSTKKLLQLDKAKLVKVAGQELVQVERRIDTDETFGQNRSPDRQLQMTVADFCQKLEEKGGDLLYLSTQESDDEEMCSTPCKQLLNANLMDETLSWAGNLSLQACNLWMGKSDKGSSSGLHHDFHDNFYLLLKGSKSFRLFPPDYALHMDTYGDIERIHPNGLISYVGSETRADGVPLEDGGDDDDDEEEAVFGKGFDYESDGDDSGLVENGRDDFDDIVEQDDPANSPATTGQDRPNNFSRIDLRGRSISEVAKEHPAFSDVGETVVHLKAGQSLYLPAGWFHEVTSLSANTDYHMALNYWFHPPDKLSDFNGPYTDNTCFAPNTNAS